MKVQMFKIMACKDREALLVAFGNSGYKVRVIEKQNPNVAYSDTLYYVQVSK